MTYRFLAFSEEEENFVMEIMASPSTTFLELHQLIMKVCGYTEDDNHQFLICNENWKIKEKINLFDAHSTSLDEDLYLMEDTTLDDFIEEEGQHIAYIFDTTGKNKLLIEYTEGIFGETTEKAYVRRQKGTAPSQHSPEEEEEYTPMPGTMPQTSVPGNGEDAESEDALSEDGYSEEELDMEGFEVTEM